MTHPPPQPSAQPPRGPTHLPGPPPARQPRATRDLIEAFPDRVLFGTDEFPPDAAAYATHFRFLETLDEHFPHSAEDPPLMGRWRISGLGLPADLLARVYSANAARLIGR